MENKINCKYNGWMNLFDYLALENHYLELFHEGKREARRRLVFQPDEANDVVSEALENLLDYFSRKPEKVFALESMEGEKMKNYLKKAMRHQVINIVKKRNRWLNVRVADLASLAAGIPGAGGLAEMEDELAENSTLVAAISHGGLEQLRAELFFFIEEKFGREKWRIKKDAVDLFMERVGNNMSISDLQEKHPEMNAAVMNTIAHRIFKKFSSWVQKNGRQPLPGSGAREVGHDG
jgi:DNA-directed RNA polymerase specialized sigma24 family protein